MNRIKLTAMAALLALVGGCAGIPMDPGDVALLGEDLRDLAKDGVIYAIARNPEHRKEIVRVRDEIAARAASIEGGTITATELLDLFKTLPFDELKSPEATLGFSGAKMIVRRAGRNVELGNIPDIQPLAQGIVTGMTEGLAASPPATLKEAMNGWPAPPLSFKAL